MTQTTVKTTRSVTADELVQALKSLGVVPENATVHFQLKETDRAITFHGIVINVVEENDNDELFKL